MDRLDYAEQLRSLADMALDTEEEIGTAQMRQQLLQLLRDVTERDGNGTE